MEGPEIKNIKVDVGSIQNQRDKKDDPFPYWVMSGTAGGCTNLYSQYTKKTSR